MLEILELVTAKKSKEAWQDLYQVGYIFKNYQTLNGLFFAALKRRPFKKIYWGERVFDVKKIINTEKIDDFRDLYRSKPEEICVFAIDTEGASKFIFIPA